jgi:hypothetical protein
MPVIEAGRKTNDHFCKLAWLNPSWCGKNAVSFEYLRGKHPDLKVRLTALLWLLFSFWMVQSFFLTDSVNGKP